MIESILIIIGLVLLYYGAEWLVGGGASLAVKAGVTPLVVGLTVVAFGTSCPELVVSVDAALSHHGEISIGNIVGSNIFNILCIVGIAGLISPIYAPGISSVDLGMMLVTAVLLFPLMRTGFVINRIEGFGLVSIYSFSFK